jgi:eukaryotic-like serine/threonine-protein kinase
LQQRYLDRYANAAEALRAIERLTTPPQSPYSSSLVPNRGSIVTIDRTAFLKLLGLGGIGLVGAFSISLILQHIQESTPTIQRLVLGSIERPTTVQVTSVKLNDRGEIIDRPQFQRQIFEENLGNGVILTMVEIPAGKFVMGAPATEEGSQPQEQPQHVVNIPAFYLGQTQVTQAQWAAIYQGKAVRSISNGRLPAHSMNWLGAIDFCDRLSDKTGHKYRLPSESEWEYACRANTTTPFAYGDSIASNIVNHNGEHPYGQAPKGIFRQRATPVATFAPNLFGLYDMHGNLWEWCLDEWFDRYDGAPADGSPRGDIAARDGQQLRVVRGGSWYSYACICRAASRAGLFALFEHDFYGMRVVCTRG